MSRVAIADGAAQQPLAPAVTGSELDSAELRVPAGARCPLGDQARDTLVYVTAGDGALELCGTPYPLAAGSAALVLAGEEGEAVAGAEPLALVAVRVAHGGDLHAPMGEREIVTRLDDAEIAAATGSRSFQILFGPHDGSLHATLFVGFIPPGAAKLHYHLYDEIVRVLDGSGRLRVGDAEHELGAGATFRLAPREVHVVENLRPDAPLVVLGAFAPAGSPSAAYLVP